MTYVPPKLKVEIELGNIACMDVRELAAMLREVATQVEADDLSTHNIKDANGQPVGYWTVTKLREYRNRQKSSEQ